MSLLERIAAELAEPDAKQRPSFYTYHRIDGVFNAATTILTSTYVPSNGKEAMIIGGFIEGTTTAAVGDRYLAANFQFYRGDPSNPLTFYRVYYHTDIAPSAVFICSLCRETSNQSWSVTAVPIVGEVLPIPSVWFTDKMAWAISLGNIPAGAADTLRVSLMVLERDA